MQKPEDGHEVVVIGAGEFAEIAYEYLTHDSPHEVVGFAVERDDLDRSEIFGLPVAPFDEIDRHYDPSRHKALVAITYTHLNRVRTRLFHDNLTVAEDTIVGAGAVVIRDTERGMVCKGNPATGSPLRSAEVLRRPSA